MVKLLVKVLVILLSFPLFAAEITVEVPAKVSAEIVEGGNYESAPLTGQISIIREAKQKVDPKSFMIEDDPLQVEFLGDERPEGQPFSIHDPESLVVSRYRFYLSPKTLGLYVLPSISVHVGNSVVKSVPVTYQVRRPQVSEQFLLEGKVKEKGPIYPGQTVNFEYRITFQHAIELNKEELALLEFDGFRNIGAPKIDTTRDGTNTIQTIIQQAVAISPGTFVSKPSLLEGYVVMQDRFGNQVRAPTLIQARSPAVEVVVSPFPDKNKPASFTGALGNFTYTSRLVSPYSIVEGEKIELEIVVTGRGDLTTVTLSDFAKEKEFKGKFRFSDIPPQGELTETAKRFRVELWPLSQAVKEVPAMHFSSFDPVFNRYVTSELGPIAISVRKNIRQENQVLDSVSVGDKKDTHIEQEKDVAVKPIEIQGTKELSWEALFAKRPLSAAFIFVLLILLAGLFFAEWLFYEYIKKKKQTPEQENSRELFLAALKQRALPNQCLPKIRQALLLRLYEVGITKTVTLHPENLAKSGIEGDIRQFLCSIEEKQFGGLGGNVEAQEIIDEATKLYYLLKMPKTTVRSSLTAKMVILFVLFLQSSVSAGVYEDKAFYAYLQGEKTQDVQERKACFNKALELYLQQVSTHPSGELLYNIGNCYYQLQEYGLALYYYYRAEKEAPRDEKIRFNIEVTKRKTRQEEEGPKSVATVIRILQKKIALFELELLLLGFALFAFTFASFFLWFRMKFFKTLTSFSLVGLLLLSSLLMWRLYFAPIEAVVVFPVQLLCGPGKEYAKVEGEPVLVGEKVEVQEASREGEWLKIKRGSGLEGYVSKENIRVI
jgi:tetratricopeptide (TPR) repeat protein